MSACDDFGAWCCSHDHPHPAGQDDGLIHGFYGEERRQQPTCIPFTGISGLIRKMRKHRSISCGVPSATCNGRGAGVPAQRDVVADDGFGDCPTDWKVEDSSVGEMALGALVLAMFAVGCVATARVGCRLVRQVAKLIG